MQKTQMENTVVNVTSEQFHKVWKLGNCCDDLYTRYCDKLASFPNYEKFVNDYYDQCDKWCRFGKDGFYLLDGNGEKDTNIDYLEIIAKYCGGLLSRDEALDNSIHRITLTIDDCEKQIKSFEESIIDNIFELYTYFVNKQIYLYDGTSYEDCYLNKVSNNSVIDVYKMLKTFYGIDHKKGDIVIPILIGGESKKELYIFADYYDKGHELFKIKNGQLSISSLNYIMLILNQCKKSVEKLLSDQEKLRSDISDIDKKLGK